MEISLLLVFPDTLWISKLCAGELAAISFGMAIWLPLVQRQLLACQHVIDTENDSSGENWVLGVPSTDAWELRLDAFWGLGASH